MKEKFIKIEGFCYIFEIDIHTFCVYFSDEHLFATRAHLFEFACFRLQIKYYGQTQYRYAYIQHACKYKIFSYLYRVKYW